MNKFFDDLLSATIASLAKANLTVQTSSGKYNLKPPVKKCG